MRQEMSLQPAELAGALGLCSFGTCKIGLSIVIRHPLGGIVL